MNRDPKSPPSFRTNPFQALEQVRGKPTAESEVATGVVVRAKQGPARAVVRYERAGRGGREVTVIAKLELDAAALEGLCKSLKKSLGCGGAVDGDEIVLQGDLRSRIEAKLLAYGVRKVTIG